MESYIITQYATLLMIALGVIGIVGTILIFFDRRK